MLSKRSLVRCSLALAILPLPAVLSAPIASASGPDVPTLMNALSGYEARVDAISQAANDAESTAAATRVLADDAQRALSDRRSVTSVGLKISSAQTTVRDASVVSTTAAGAVLDVLLDHTYALVYSSNGQASTTWQEAIPARVTFRTDGPIPDITSTTDQYVTETHSQIPDQDSVANEPTTTDDTDTVPSADVNAAVEPPGTDWCNNVYPPNYCYNRGAAVNYVKAHACSTCHDSSWYYYSGEDCTNFMSAALYKSGNWRQREDGQPYSTSWWWHGSGNSSHSLTWTVANKFYWFNVLEGRAKKTSTLSSLLVGDLFQADFGADGKIDHSAMVTKKDSTGFYMSYHSTDTLNIPWTTFRSRVSQQGYSSPKYYGWLMQDVYSNAA
jgi:hypothetical protein